MINLYEQKEQNTNKALASIEAKRDELLEALNICNTERSDIEWRIQRVRLDKLIVVT